MGFAVAGFGGALPVFQVEDDAGFDEGFQLPPEAAALCCWDGGNIAAGSEEDTNEGQSRDQWPGLPHLKHPVGAPEVGFAGAIAAE